MKRKLIILDMDGVITSEDGYWRAAYSTITELAAFLGHLPSEKVLTSANCNRLPWEIYLDLKTIASVKNLRINTNWDLCHIAAIGLFYNLCKFDSENVLRILKTDWSSANGGEKCSWPADYFPDSNLLISDVLQFKDSQIGFGLMNHFSKIIPDLNPILVRNGVVWEWLYSRFQSWFDGSPISDSQSICENPPPRKGIINDEKLITEARDIERTLSRLKNDDWKIGIATGRTSAELLPTLKRFNILQFFDTESIVTHDSVVTAENELIAKGEYQPLSKPHPYQFLRAIYPNASCNSLAKLDFHPIPAGTVIVGDTIADIAAGVSLGAVSVGVLSGPLGLAGRKSLFDAGATFIINDFTSLNSILN